MRPTSCSNAPAWRVWQIRSSLHPRPRRGSPSRETATAAGGSVVLGAAPAPPPPAGAAPGAPAGAAPNLRALSRGQASSTMFLGAPRLSHRRQLRGNQRPQRVAQLPKPNAQLLSAAAASANSCSAALAHPRSSWRAEIASAMPRAHMSAVMVPPACRGLSHSPAVFVVVSHGFVCYFGRALHGK